MARAFRRLKQVVIFKFIEGGQRFGSLQKRHATALQDLLRLHNEFYLADPAATEFYVAFKFAAFDDLVFDALFHFRDFPWNLFRNRPRIPKGLNHFEELCA